STTPLDSRLMSIARSREARTPVTMISFESSASCAIAPVALTIQVASARLEAERASVVAIFGLFIAVSPQYLHSESGAFAPQVKGSATKTPKHLSIGEGKLAVRMCFHGNTAVRLAH